MRILKVISLLLDYPDQHLRDGHAELAQAIGSAREISPEQRIALRRLLDELTEGDLMAQYTEAGFAIGVRELPDYIPLYLEYLATREDLEAREGLADVAHLLALLAARLQERESPHAACFTALLQIAGEPVQETLAGLQEQVAAEERDDSLEALDKIWEEEQVNFLQAEQQDRCPSMPSGPGKAREESPVPLHWTDFKHDGQAAALAQEVRNV